MKRLFFGVVLTLAMFLVSCNPLRYAYTKKLVILPSAVLAQNATSLKSGETGLALSTAFAENTVSVSYGLFPNLEVSLSGSQCFVRRSWDAYAALKYRFLSWEDLDLAFSAGDHVSYSDWNGGYIANYVRVPFFVSWHLPDESIVVSFSSQFWFELFGQHLSTQSVLPAVSLLSWHVRFENAVKEIGDQFPLRTGLEISHTQPLGMVDLSDISAQLYYVGVDVSYRFGKVQ